MSMAFSNAPDEMIVAEGVAWVKQFKKMVKAVAQNTANKLGPENVKFESRDKMRLEHASYFDNMYLGLEATTRTLDLVRLAAVQHLLGCRSTRHTTNARTSAVPLQVSPSQKFALPT